MKNIIITVLFFFGCSLALAIDRQDNIEQDMTPHSPKFIPFWEFSGGLMVGGASDDEVLQSVMQRFLDIARAHVTDRKDEAKIKFAEGMLDRAVGNYDGYLKAMKYCAERIPDELPFAQYIYGRTLFNEGNGERARIIWENAAAFGEKRAILWLAFLNYDEGIISHSDLKQILEDVWPKYAAPKKYVDITYLLEILENNKGNISSMESILKSRSSQGDSQAKALYFSLCYEEIISSSGFDYDKMINCCSENEYDKLCERANLDHIAAVSHILRCWAQYAMQRN